MALFIILLCWFVKMPLWLSIVGTVLAGLRIIKNCIDEIVSDN